MATETSSSCDLANEVEDSPNLPKLFDALWKKWEETEKSDEPTVSDKYKKTVSQGRALAERAIHMVNQLQLFSDNERLEEVASNEIKFMLLSAFLGYFQQRVTQGERLDNIQRAKLYYLDFLRLCKNYAVKEINVPELEDDNDDEDFSEQQHPTHIRGPPKPDLRTMNSQRDQKIAKFKEQKELERQLVELKAQVDKDHVDDEVKRNYYTTLLKKWINNSADELVSINDELLILRHISQMKLGNSGDSGLQRRPEPPKQKLRPFILTKTKLQKEVFGAGYPSLPTYTLEEFYDQQVALGQLPDSMSSMNGASANPMSEAEANDFDQIKKENDIENDDAEALAKARSWDDWKDDHRTGWGNTQNKG